MNLDDVLAKLATMPDAERKQLEELAAEQTKGRKFIPSPGPQTDAYFSKADVLLYGGAAGGGKSALINGLALQEHTNSLIMRRRYTDLMGGGGMVEEVLKLHGSRNGFNGSSPPTLRTEDGRTITFGGAANLGDEQAFQGRARDFLGLDEATQFLEAQVRFLMGWVRTTDPNQRTRTLLASNPPVSAAGDWIVGMFRPWLDLTHSNPAKPGELRWYVTDPDGDDMEVDGPEPIEVAGRTLIPTSRTFIPAMLADNPFLAKSDYGARLDALPEPLRSAMRDGNFMLARQDDPWQVIPTEWIRAAQARWTPEPPAHAPMTAMGVDIAQGGRDNTTIAMRYDAWFAEIKQVPGSETPTGNEVAGLVIAERRNGATIILDMGGGYGGATKMRLADNDIQVKSFKGAETSGRRTKDQQLGFVNNRAEALWRLREALDPAQDGGSPVALPPDPEIVADLTAPLYEITSRGVKVTPKEKVVEMLGRSPDKGDAIMMANFAGPKLATHGNQWRGFQKSANAPKVVLGRERARRKRHV